MVFCGNGMAGLLRYFLEGVYVMDDRVEDSYRVLLTGGEGEYVEKKSRFIATL